MPRRGQGEGSIRRRSTRDGWEARYYVTDADGKRRRESVYGNTRAEVQRQLKEALRQRESGAVAAPGLTVGQFLTQWLLAIRSTVRPKTYTSYEGTVRLHLAPTLGRHPLRKLGPTHIGALLTAKSAGGLSPTSVRYILLVLRIALSQAQRWELLSRNVATLVDPPRIAFRPVRVLTAEESTHLLDAIKGDRLEALYVVGLTIGLRRGELLGLRWQNVDLDAPWLRVDAALQRVGGVPQLVETKTAKSRRMIVLPGICASALKHHRARQAADRDLAESDWIDTDLVFTNRLGGAIDADWVSKHFQQLLRRAGLPKLRFHDLRHGAASLLLAQGVPARVVMEVLGHSQIGVTLNIYSHVAPQLSKEAANAMDRAITEARLARPIG